MVTSGRRASAHRCGEVHREHQWTQPDATCTIACTVCGAEAYSHDWDGCVCRRCGRQRDSEHQMERVEGTCNVRCTVCGLTCESHRWEAGRCAVCGLDANRFAEQCAQRLHDLYTSNPDGLTFAKPERIVVELIGEALDDAGNMALMRRAHALFTSMDRNGNGRNLEMLWDGIGDWRG